MTKVSTMDKLTMGGILILWNRNPRLAQHTILKYLTSHRFLALKGHIPIYVRYMPLKVFLYISSFDMTANSSSSTFSRSFNGKQSDNIHSRQRN